jgi:hypothetical protein
MSTSRRDVLRSSIRIMAGLAVLSSSDLARLNESAIASGLRQFVNRILRGRFTIHRWSPWIPRSGATTAALDVMKAPWFDVIDSRRADGFILFRVHSRMWLA